MKVKKILWAEDNMDAFVKFQKLFIEHAKIDNIRPEIMRAEDGNAVFRHLVQNNFDIVILDVEMPNFNGLETIEVLHQKYKKLPLFVVSSRLSNPDFQCKLDEFKGKGIILDYFDAMDHSSWLNGISHFLKRQYLVSLLHLSDLHFGGGHKFNEDNLLLSLNNCLDEISNYHPEVLIVSGDLTQGGEESEFCEAKKFLEFLIKKLNISKTNVIIIPGNHDIYRKGDVKRRFDNYINFLNMFYDGDDNVISLKRYHKIYDDKYKELRPMKIEKPSDLFQIVELNDFNTLIFGFNTVESEDDKLKFSKIHKEQLSYALKYLKENDSNGLLKIALFHHHILSIPDVHSEDTSKVLNNAGFALHQLLNNVGVKLILHGHTHRQVGYKYEPLFVNSKDSNPAICVFSPGKFFHPAGSDSNMHLSIIRIVNKEQSLEYNIQFIPYEINLQQGIDILNSPEISIHV